MASAATELGATLRAWRDRLSPRAAGLPSGYARRARGLRREELAELAGISVDYVVRLEQGRSTTPSAQVLAALARALRLTTAERDHLYRLARIVPPTDEEISDHLPPGLQRVLNRLGDTAVAVFAADWQLVWWNRGWAALLGDPKATPPALRNFARNSFSVDVGRRADRRQRAFRGVVGGGHGRCPSRGPQGGGPPRVGPIELDCDVLTDGDAERKIVILDRRPRHRGGDRLRLAFLAGVPDPIAR